MKCWEMLNINAPIHYKHVPFACKDIFWNLSANTHFYCLHVSQVVLFLYIGHHFYSQTVFHEILFKSKAPVLHGILKNNKNAIAKRVKKWMQLIMDINKSPGQWQQKSRTVTNQSFLMRSFNWSVFNRSILPVFRPVNKLFWEKGCL